MAASPTVLVVGASRGIGLELVRQLRAAGATVLATCRGESPALVELGAEVISGVDVGSDGVGAVLQAGVGDRQLDVVIHNAGVLDVDGLDDLGDLAGGNIERQMNINAFGALRVAFALREKFANPGKLALITSRMGSVADNTSGRMYGYRMSKAALNMAGKSLATDLAPAGVAVQLYHPGMVATDMTARFGHDNCVTTEQSAAGLLARINEMTLETTGKFFHMSGEELPW